MSRSLTLRQLLRFARDPERLRAEAATLREATEREAARRAAEGPTEDEFAAWTPEEQAAYIDRLAEQTETEEREQARAASRAEGETKRRESLARRDELRSRGVALLGDLAGVLADLRAVTADVCSLESQIHHLDGPPPSTSRTVDVGVFGEDFERLQTTETDPERRKALHDLVTLIDPTGCHLRQLAATNRRGRRVTERHRAIERVERVEREIAVLRAGTLVRLPPQNGQGRPPGVYLSAGGQLRNDIRSEEERQAALAALEATLAQARQTVAQTEDVAMTPTPRPAVPSDP